MNQDIGDKNMNRIVPRRMFTPAAVASLDDKPVQTPRSSAPPPAISPNLVLAIVLGEEAWIKMPYLKRHFDEISARPAAVRANALKEKHAFKTEMDNEARRHLFPQNVQRVV